MFEQLPILSLNLNASFVLIQHVNYPFLFWYLIDRIYLSLSIFLISICLSYVFFHCHPVLIHGYFSFVSSFFFFNMLTNLLNCSHKTVCGFKSHIICSNSVVEHLALFCNSQLISSLVSITFLWD